MSQAQHDRLVWCARVCVLSVAMVSQYMMNGVVVSVCVCVVRVADTEGRYCPVAGRRGAVGTERRHAH